MRKVKLQQPFLNGLAAGKWDRFATFGEKVQDGQRFVFSTETLSQIVDNFATLYKGRRLGMDYEHQAMNASTNGKAAPCLAYYNALCVVENGQVVKFHAQRPDVQQPDPGLLLSQLRVRFPDIDDVDGLWGYRCEHTPMGVELLPNYEQISPLFTSDGADEQSRPVGYVLMNVSAVNVAFQDGTVFNLKSALGYGDSSLHTPEPVSSRKGAMKMADKEEKDEGEKPSALRSECMKKLGLPDDASDDAMYGALMAQKFGDLEIKHEDEEDKPKDMGAMAEELPPAAMSKVLSRLEQEVAARKASEERVAALEAIERNRAVSAFRKFALSRLDGEKDADEWLSDFGGDIPKATKALSRLPEKQTGIFSRVTQNGSPVGGDPVVSGSAIEHVAGLKIIGRGLTGMAKTILEKGEAKTIGEAQLIAARRAPHLYR